MEKQLTARQSQEVLSKLEVYLQALKSRWDSENVEKPSWWKIPTNYIVQATLFIIGTIDELINFVEDDIPDGATKKIAVLTVIGKLFDYIIIQSLPIWMKPFAKILKQIVIKIIINQLIDFIVDKYKKGYWNLQEAKNDKKQVQTTTV